MKKHVPKQMARCGRAAAELAESTDVSHTSRLGCLPDAVSVMKTGRITFCESLKGKEVLEEIQFNIQLIKWRNSMILKAVVKQITKETLSRFD